MRAAILCIHIFFLILLCLTANIILWNSQAEASAFGDPMQAVYARHSDKPEEELELSIRSSPDSTFRSTLRIRSDRWSVWLRKLEAIDNQPVQSAAYSYIELSVMRGTARTIYQWNDTDSILLSVHADSAAARVYRVPAPMAEALHSITAELRKAHFGKAVNWPAANRLLPRKAYLTITDMETGLTFQGQRRAGSSHADVQPLTKADSTIMKQIYGGSWSWNRRAILVQSPEGSVAASMHGMPHGGDGIPDNNFDGHFCIHFDGTVTHGSGHSDPAHQAMVHKAAGRLLEYHRSLTPDQLVELFLVASKQKDSHLLGLLLNPSSTDFALIQKEWLDNGPQGARRVDARDGSDTASQPASDKLQFTLDTRINVWRTGARPQTIHYIWSFSRPSSGHPWVIDRIDPVGRIKIALSNSAV
jgi:hypothetical protein